eukprot:COSAG06_NODE_15073_length_1099_cov_1.926000_2_plen_78_part_00
MFEFRANGGDLFGKWKVTADFVQQVFAEINPSTNLLTLRAMVCDEGEACQGAVRRVPLCSGSESRAAVQPWVGPSNV